MKKIIDDKVVVLSTDYKAPPGELMLAPPPSGRCNHYPNHFEVDVKGGKCKCLTCNEEVSAMFVLEQLMHKESQWNRTRTAYDAEMKRIAERSKTKCLHCGAMTRISRA